MKISVERTILFLGLLAAVAIPAALAEEPSSSPEKPAADKPDGEKPTPPAAKPEEEVDPFAVPDGNPEELLKYIDGLRALRPEGIRSRRAYMDFVVKGRKALLEATEKILAGKPTDEQFNKAAELKLGALEVLSQLNFPGTNKTLTDFVDQLTKAGKTKLARTGQGILLNIKARKPATAESTRKLFAEVKRFLSEGPITRNEASLMATVGRSFEHGDDPKLAARAYKEFAALLSKSKSEDEAIAGLAEKFAGAARRLELPGNPIQIEGVTPEGEKFDWEKFQKGNVVLIDFWATWCGWCIREIPEMKELYEAYHDRGFEIVGLSADADPEALERFLDQNEIPWTILYGKEGPSPTIAYYGISGFPTMLLVDKQGKVVSLHARGPELRKELRQLLGPIKEKEDGEKDAPVKGKKKKNKKSKGKKAKEKAEPQK